MFVVVFAVMVPGSAPTKAAQVRTTSSALRWISFLLFGHVQRCVCVGECLVVGQSHFKTFDNKFFTFTGRCQYLLARDCTGSEFSVIIENVQVSRVTFLDLFAILSEQKEIISCHSIVLVCGRSGCRVHSLCHPDFALAGGHDGEAEARRSCLCQRHGHPDTNAPWLVALADSCVGSQFQQILETFWTNVLTFFWILFKLHWLGNTVNPHADRNIGSNEPNQLICD